MKNEPTAQNFDDFSKVRCVPIAFAIACIVSTVVLSPFSMPTYLRRLMPALSATSCCVRCCALRSALNWVCSAFISLRFCTF